MPDVQDADLATGDREERPVDAATATIEELADFGLDRIVFGRKSATLGRFGKGIQGVHKSVEPAGGGAGRTLANLLVSRVEILKRGWLDDEAVFFHALEEILCFLRRRLNASSAGIPSPRSIESRPRLIPAMASARSTRSSMA